MADSTPFAHGLVTRLDRLCPRLGVQDLPPTVRTVEQETRRQIEEAVRAICFPTAPSESVELRLHGVPYEIRVADYPDDPSSLGVAVSPQISVGGPPRPSLLRVKTPSLLRAQSAILCLPEELRTHEDNLAAVTANIIGAASTWLERRLISSLRIAEADVISSIYTYFLSLVPRELQSIPIWFGTASKDQSHYVLDPGVAAGALSALVASAESRTLGPGACMADFLNAMVPTHQAFSTEVIKGDHCLEIDFKEAKYRTDFSSAQVAEIAMFGGTCASLFPVCVAGDTYLIAVFPTEYKGVVLPILEASKAELSVRFSRARSKLDRAYRQLVARGWGWSPGKLGEFLGGAAVGAANAST